MSVLHYENLSDDLKHLFKLDTPNTSYLIGIFDDEMFIGHIYYGEHLNTHDLSLFVRSNESPFVPSKNNRDRGSFLDSFPMEYPTHGLGDYRQNCLSVEDDKGYSGVSLSYESFEIIEGKSRINNLPSSFGNKDEVSTLIIHGVDKLLNLKIDLYYSVFSDVDVITRRVSIKNEGENPVYLTKVYSACLDLDDKDYEAISLHGAWARERHIESTKVSHKRTVVESYRGESSHQDHPFLAIKSKGTDDDHGKVYAMNFVYSGNFHAGVMLDQFDQVRMTMGINSTDFRWKLTQNETFDAPEVVMQYSNEGLGKMTRTFHDFYRKHLIRSPYLHKKRPILINNWEATYFEFDTEKLIAIAKKASALGIEMLVMDDGWFGNRFDDNRALGDWNVNEEKIKGGLKYLVDEVNKLGMKFGIWFEPEMISPDSELYRKHPDWAIGIPSREGTRLRNQFVLDLSNEEVIEHTYESIASVLRSANIEYVKWDMNRQLSDLGSLYLPSDRMGELSHRFVLGMYSLQERLLKEFPNLLLENCSGGGARFDPGMLYYSPQIWCSDDTDAIERLSIQEGTALIYPLSSMGAHVSDCPNHTVQRNTPFETRGHVALAGTFGYELDVTRIPKEDVEMIPEQVSMYHKYNDLVREGDYYRIASYSENRSYDCYGVVSKDKKEALFTYVQVLARPNYHRRRIFFKGLDRDRDYCIESTNEIVRGELLMKVGYLIDNLPGDFKSTLIHLSAV